MISFSLHYFRWHYTKALSDIVHITGNFLWFVFQIFPVVLLCKTFFVPFKRIRDTPVSMLYPQEFAEALAVNTIMRIVGMVLRSVLLVCGLLSAFGVLIASVCFFVAWIVSPLLVLFLFGFCPILFVFG